MYIVHNSKGVGPHFIHKHIVTVLDPPLTEGMSALIRIPGLLTVTLPEAVVPPPESPPPNTHTHTQTHTHTHEGAVSRLIRLATNTQQHTHRRRGG